MPHQCLKCGKIFEEGSSQLLKGCPSCGGKRFFFTKKPLNEQERSHKMEKVGKDLNTRLIELVEENKEVMDKSGNWVKLKPKEVRQIVKKKLSEKQKEKIEDKPKLEEVSDEEYRRSVIEKIKSEANKRDGKPETIDIEKTGKYNIDLKGLLEEEPIIIQKDGSYTIHLPSIFKMIDD